MEPGLASTWPRSTSSFFVPRSSTPMLSPAWPWSRSLRNISTPVQVVFWVSRRPDDLDLVAGVDDALLDLAGHDGAATGDREHVLDRHEERLVELAHRLGDERVDRFHQLDAPSAASGVAFERLERRDPDRPGCRRPGTRTR